MLPWYFRTKMLWLYCAVLTTGSLSILLIQLYSESSSGRKLNMTDFSSVQITINTSYSAKLNFFERTRLGFAIQPEFQVKPKPWQDILFDKSWLGREPSERKPSIKAKQKRKKVLMVGRMEYGDFIECPKDKNKNLNYNCDFIDWEKGQHISREYDAIFVYGKYASNNHIDLSFDLNSDPNSKSTMQKPPKVIYYTLESPYPPNSIMLQVGLKYRNGSRAYLATYWRGSDIYVPYFRYKPSNKSQFRGNNHDKNYALGRTKMAAIVISNCFPNNDRERLVQELQKYVQVDIFGACGTLDCSKRDCFKEIKKNYKFYLAFENSNCRDYITEKLHSNSYGNDLLPIVFGAHPSDYMAIAPPNSYIHIEDFESIEKLGDYMHLLDKNDTLYNSYFAWKEQGDFSTSEDLLCEICGFLHTDDLNEESAPKLKDSGSHRSTTESKILPYLNGEDKYDFQRFDWSDENLRMCLPYDEWYWNK